VRFVDQMRKLSKDYLASTYLQWLKENNMFDNAKSRSAYAALGTIVQQFVSLSGTLADDLFVDSAETTPPTHFHTLEENIDALGISLAQTKVTSPVVARDVQICITKLEDIKYRYILMIKPIVEN
jgi:predicted AlkP superfamily phosphohydrolase/phosphomutase